MGCRIALGSIVYEGIHILADLLVSGSKHQPYLELLLVVVLEAREIILIADHLHVLDDVVSILPDIFEAQHQQLLLQLVTLPPSLCSPA